MQTEKFPGLSLASEELNKSLEHLQNWLNSRISAAKKISTEILNLFEDGTKEKELLTFPATLMGESSGWVYTQIADKFPQNLTLLECIILTGIDTAQNPTIRSKAGWEQVVTKMSDAKKILQPGKNFSVECDKIADITGKTVMLQPFNASSKTDIYVFCVKFDFEKSIPETVSL
jgi:hypothetical protein